MAEDGERISVDEGLYAAGLGNNSTRAQLHRLVRCDIIGFVFSLLLDHVANTAQIFALMQPSRLLP